MSQVNGFDYAIYVDDTGDLGARIDALLAAENLTTERKAKATKRRARGSKKSVDLRPMIAAIEIADTGERPAILLSAVVLFHLTDKPRGEPEAIGHEGLAMAVIPAAGRAGLEKLAGDVSMGDFARFVVFQLVEAAAAAAVAQGLPFFSRQFGERTLPELVPQRTHLASSAATASAP